MRTHLIRQGIRHRRRLVTNDDLGKLMETTDV
jgi:hypothetical protein